VSVIISAMATGRTVRILTSGRWLQENDQIKVEDKFKTLFIVPTDANNYKIIGMLKH
jgi:hypothetical protein